MELIYCKGTRESAERVEFNYGEAVCCVNADMLICGVSKHPCTNDDVYCLSLEEQLDILRLIERERSKITDKPGAKSLQDWNDSGLRTLEEYLRPGDKVTEEFVDYFVNIMPPTTCRSNLVQSGEPYSNEKDENGHYRPTYDTFYKKDGVWRFVGWCYARELQNRVTKPSRLAERIALVEERLEKSKRKAEYDGKK